MFFTPLTVNIRPQAAVPAFRPAMAFSPTRTVVVLQPFSIIDMKLKSALKPNSYWRSAILASGSSISRRLFVSRS